MARSLAVEIKKLHERNKKVEADKAWETSSTRRVLIAILTYVVFVVFFLSANLPRPYVNALVPAVAFVLSTLTLDAAKKLWLR